MFSIVFRSYSTFLCFLLFALSTELDSSSLQQKVNMFVKSQALYIFDVIALEDVETIALELHRFFVSVIKRNFYAEKLLSKIKK